MCIRGLVRTRCVAVLVGFLRVSCLWPARTLISSIARVIRGPSTDILESRTRCPDGCIARRTRRATRGGPAEPDGRAATYVGAFQRTGSASSPGADSPISRPRLRQCGAPNAVSRARGAPRRRCSDLWPLSARGGRVGAGGARWRAMFRSLSQAFRPKRAKAGTPWTPGPAAPSAWPCRAEIPMCVLVARDIGTSELRQRARARERPQDDRLRAVEQRPFTRSHKRACPPTPARRDRLAEVVVGRRGNRR